jgi:quercetin dioxygenase-like cupin family protein
VHASPRVVWMPGAVRTEIHLQSADTSGGFCLLVDHPPAGWSLPMHLHRGAAETIYIVDGEFEMQVAGRFAGREEQAEGRPDWR